MRRLAGCRQRPSTRSDAIANRQVDVWEVAYVWAWPLHESVDITILEVHLLHTFNRESPLVNGAIPPAHEQLPFPVPERVRVQVMADAEVQSRRNPALRLPRQIQHFNALVDYILNTQDKPHLRRAMQVYFGRLTRYFQEFIEGEE